MYLGTGFYTAEQYEMDMVRVVGVLAAGRAACLYVRAGGVPSYVLQSRPLDASAYTVGGSLTCSSIQPQKHQC